MAISDRWVRNWQLIAERFVERGEDPHNAYHAIQKLAAELRRVRSDIRFHRDNAADFNWNNLMNSTLPKGK